MTVSVANALAQARGQGLSRLDAQLLLAHTLQCRREWLLAHDDALLTPHHEAQFNLLCTQRQQAVPVAYLLGEKEFAGLMLKVTPAVLVPRPDSETLLDWALECVENLPSQATVLDLGTGSGALALAIKHRQLQALVTATDLSPAALAVAKENATRLALEVRFVEGAWWQAVPGETFDLVLSNPPYIAGDDGHLAALAHEPHMALTPGGDGLGSLREICASALAHLRPGAWLLLEHGSDQGEAVAAMLQTAGMQEVSKRNDLAGHWRCTGARATA